MSKHKTIKTLRGAASMYAVVFAMLVFGIITLSFIRIVVSDAVQSTNTDLYQSAYDSAMAGLEDAKIALLKYHDCLNQGITANPAANVGTCGRIVYEMENGANNGSCDVVSKVLGRDQESENEVVVQETQHITDAGNSYDLAQSYTCVKITEKTLDYLSTLTSTDTVRNIPVRTADFANLKTIEFSWYSDANGTSYNYMGSADRKFLKKNTTAYTPPVVTFEIFQTDSVNGVPNFSLGELSVNNSNSTGTDHALMMFYPVSSGGANHIDANTVLYQSDKHANEPLAINCGPDGDYACTVKIDFPPAFRNQPRAESTTFLRVTLPYDRPTTDFSVTLCTDTDCTTTSDFTGVQAAVDSTGRANDLFRRIESRIELVDLYYPYPEFAIHLDGDDDLYKNFYVTRNCWRADNGSSSGCSNSGDVTDNIYTF